MENTALLRTVAFLIRLNADSFDLAEKDVHTLPYRESEFIVRVHRY